MLSSARKRRFVARSSTLLLVEVALAAVPATAAATLVPPVALPGVPTVSPPSVSPTALASGRCRGAGSRHASSAVLRRAMLCLVNHARMSAGLSPFRAERHLARAAARHAADMGRRHYFAHVSPSGKGPLSRARSAGWHGGVGEVIAGAPGRSRARARPFAPGSTARRTTRSCSAAATVPASASRAPAASPTG